VIVVPWHGAITMGEDIEIAAALQSTFDYACRLDVTVGADAPVMPDEHAETMQGLLAKADYLRLTWELLCRKAARGFDGTFTTPLVQP
jgi:hypothetical protein